MGRFLAMTNVEVSVVKKRAVVWHELSQSSCCFSSTGGCGASRSVSSDILSSWLFVNWCDSKPVSSTWEPAKESSVRASPWPAGDISQLPADEVEVSQSRVTEIGRKDAKENEKE
jgi:hypothetical protein